MDTEPAKQLLKFTGHSRKVKCCALSPDSKLVVSVDQGSSVVSIYEGSSVMVSMCIHTCLREELQSLLLVFHYLLLHVTLPSPPSSSLPLPPSSSFLLHADMEV